MAESNTEQTMDMTSEMDDIPPFLPDLKDARSESSEIESSAKALLDASEQQSEFDAYTVSEDMISSYDIPPAPRKSDQTTDESLFTFKDITADNFTEFLEKLRFKQIECEETEDYLQAEEIMFKVDKVKRHLEKKESESLKEQHQLESNDLEMGHMTEFQSFNQAWDDRMQEYEEKSKHLKETLTKKHEEAIAKETQQMENTLPTLGRPTAEWLNLKTIKENMVKVKRYHEAHELNQKMIEIENREHEKFLTHRQHKIDSAIAKIVKRQNVENETLDKRITFGLEELKKERILQLDRFIKRYQAAKKECTIQQALQKNKLNRKHNEGSGRTKVHTAAEQRTTTIFDKQLESARRTPDIKKIRYQIQMTNSIQTSELKDILLSMISFKTNFADQSQELIATYMSKYPDEARLDSIIQTLESKSEQEYINLG